MIVQQHFEQCCLDCKNRTKNLQFTKLFSLPSLSNTGRVWLKKNNRTWSRSVEASAKFRFGVNIEESICFSLFFLWAPCYHAGHGHPLSPFSDGSPSNHLILGFGRGEHILRVQGIKPCGKD